MKKHNVYYFAEPFYQFVLSLFSWIRWIFGFQKITSQESVKILSPKDGYIELQKKKLLMTFQEEQTGDWNSNIDDIMKDQTRLAELLKNSKNDLEQKWRARILIENTPRGNVIMFYDIYKRAFSYYCDQAVMPYDIMNAVAMKYVLTFHCRDFFVDSNVLPSPLSSSVEEPQDKSTLSKPIPLDKQAFAKFKTYNNSTKKAGILPENDKTINCFLHLGASRNWSPISKKTKMNPINGFQTDLLLPNNKKLSYLDYKKQTSH